MNSAEWKYSAGGQETLPVLFTLQKYLVYPLPIRTVKSITDHKALKHFFENPTCMAKLHVGWTFCQNMTLTCSTVLSVKITLFKFLSRPYKEWANDE